MWNGNFLVETGQPFEQLLKKCIFFENIQTIFFKPSLSCCCWLQIQIFFIFSQDSSSCSADKASYLNEINLELVATLWERLKIKVFIGNRWKIFNLLKFNKALQALHKGCTFTKQGWGKTINMRISGFKLQCRLKGFLVYWSSVLYYLWLTFACKAWIFDIVLLLPMVV